MIYILYVYTIQRQTNSPEKNVSRNTLTVYDNIYIYIHIMTFNIFKLNTNTYYFIILVFTITNSAKSIYYIQYKIFLSK